MTATVARVVRFASQQPPVAAPSSWLDPDRHPPAVTRLSRIGATLAGIVDRPRLHSVVTVPTMTAAAAVVVLGALGSVRSCTDCAHRRIVCGARATIYSSHKYTDTEIRGVDSRGCISFGGNSFIDPDRVSVLPAGFPDRRDHRLDDAVKQALADVHECLPEQAGLRELARSTHPVVVVGRGVGLCSGTTLLDPNGDRRLPTLLNPGVGLPQWFRHPVIRTGALPPATPALTALRPRLVVLVGAAACRYRAGSARLWPHTPTLTLLSRRSPADCGEAADLRDECDLDAGRVDDIPMLQAGQDGLEISTWIGRCANWTDLDDEDDW